MEASLITMVVAALSQSDVGWVKSEYYLNRLSRSSSLVDSYVGILLLTSFSIDVMVSKISFMVTFFGWIVCLPF